MSLRYKGGIISATPPEPTTSSATGVWTLQQQMQAQAAGNWPVAPAVYTIDRSLRFNSADSTYLSRTPSSGNRKVWTWSGWVKKATNGGDYKVLFEGYNNTTSYCALNFTDSDQLRIDEYSGLLLLTNSVYRDLSAWYHIVYAVDTTQATNTNRVKIYVNGVQVTSFATSTYPSQYYDTQINNAVSHSIGQNLYPGYPQSFNGYMADVQFIDGAALDPSYFGQTNATTGVWEPIAYTGNYSELVQVTSGEYSTSGTPWNSSREWADLLNNALTDGVYAADGTNYTITFSPALTVSSQVLIEKLPASYQGVSSSGWLVNGSVSKVVGDFSGDTLALSSATLGGSLSSIRITSAASGSDCSTVVNIYVDGKQVRLNTVVGNGFHLDFADNSSTTTIGYDTSGNGNNWTTNNFSVTAGAGNDSLVDTPTPYGTDTGAGGEVGGNYCTWNPIAPSRQGTPTFSNGNLDVVISASGTYYCQLYSTMAVSSGKWYAEVTYSARAASYYALMVGIMRGAELNTEFDSKGVAYFAYNGNKLIDGTSTSYGATYFPGDVIGVALDLDAGEVTFYKNNTSQGTITLPSSTSGWIVSIANTTSTGTQTAIGNFGQRPFAYTAPSGFKALCTTNLPAPDVVQGDTAFNTVLYTGDSSYPRSITGVGFQPDFVWTKARSTTYSHVLYDVLRGTGTTKSLYTDTSSAEGTYASNTNLSSFDSDGFTIGTTSSTNVLNNSGVTLVAWNWKAGGAGSSNTDGSITSTVSANPTAGFSVVTYTGTGANASVGHGLGVTPSWIIIKRRNDVGDWQCFGNTLFTRIQLNTTGGDDGNYGLTFGSSTFAFNASLPADTDWNGSGSTYVAYCFAAVEGFSAFGSYVANGSTDGNFIYTGMAPRFILVKCASAAENWAIFDTATNTYNVAGKFLRPNLSDAELDSPPRIDILSNGFKIRTAGTNLPNATGETYIYMAFAENPFKYALAR